MSIEKSHQTDPMDFISYEIFQKIFNSVFRNFDDNENPNFNQKHFDQKKAIILFYWPQIIAKRYLYPHFELSLFKEQCKLNHLLKNDFNIDELLDQIFSFHFGNYFFKNLDKLENTLTESDINEIINKSHSFIDLSCELYDKYEDEIGLKKILNDLDKTAKEKILDLALGGKPDIKNNRIFQTSKLVKKIFYTILIDRIIGCEVVGKKIRNGIVYYYLVLILFLVNYGKKSNQPNSDYEDCDLDDDSDETSIDTDEIIELIIEYSNNSGDQGDKILSSSLELLLTSGSILFLDAIKFFINDYKDIILKDGLSKKGDFEEYQFFKNNPKYIASIMKMDNCNHEPADNYVIEVEREIRLFDDFEYKLDFWFQKDLCNNEFIDLITFKCDDKNDPSKQLLSCLSVLAYRLSVHINDYTNKYNYFISNADICVDNNLDNFLENIDTIRNSYHLFNEYSEQKDFSRAIENLDIDLGYKCIEETRNAIKKRKKQHLSPKLIQDLLTANNEICLLYSSIQRQHDAHKSRMVKEFFKDNPHYFKIIIFNDIKDIEFSSDPNGIRNTRRKIFHGIANRAGKEIAGYKIAKELALE